MDATGIDQTTTQNNVTTHISGGCACGAIRYQCTAKPIMMLHCHCRDCQRSSGAASVSAMIVPGEAFKLLQGSPRFYASTSEMGGHVQRGFCESCGSPVLAKFDAAPQLVGIRPGSLDDPGCFQPQLDMWTSDAQPWDVMNPALPKFEKYPPFGQPEATK
jgi:hypothetical protein